MSERSDVHLAQYNIAVLRHPMEHPANQSFEALLDETNRLAEASPGFVWRHGIDSRDVDDTAYDDPHVLVNASVWESFEQLREYAFRGWHRDVFKRRAEWFVASAATMWWVPTGHTPSLHECVARLAFQHIHGATPYAFGMNERHRRLVVRQRSDEGTTVLEAEVDGTVEASLRLALHDTTQAELTPGPVSAAGASAASGCASWLTDAAMVVARELGCATVRHVDGSITELIRPYHWPPTGHP